MTPSEPRPAVGSDVTEIVRLAGAMYDWLGFRDPDPTWLARAEAEVRSRLGADLAVFVVEHPAEMGRLIAIGAGTVSRRLPTPRPGSGPTGYVQWIATDPAFRRRGHARGVLTALLSWFESCGADVVELHASSDGEALYRSLGFDDPRAPALRRGSAWAVRLA